MTVPPEGFRGPLFSIDARNAFRMWTLADALGETRLSGVAMNDYIWTPGENISQHLGVAPLADPAECQEQYHPHTKQHLDDCPRTACEHPTTRCCCGFYGYFAVSYWLDRQWNAFAEPSIGGVIAGYGRCVIGTKGIRAGKAAILALAEPVIVGNVWLVQNRITRADLVEYARWKLGEHYRVPFYRDTEAMTDALLDKP